jgi:flagellar hook-associated protein 3 FlgL
MFDILRDLRTALQNDDQTGIRNQIDLLTEAQGKLQTVRTVNNAQYKHMEMTETHHGKVKVSVQTSLADIQKADMTTAVLELQMQQTSYEAALVAASKVFEQSLLDFLR